MHTVLCRYEYQAWQDEEHGLQRIVRDGVETNIQVLGEGEVRTFAPPPQKQRHMPYNSSGTMPALLLIEQCFVWM